MGTPLVQLHLTLVTLKGRCQGHSGFEGLYLVKELGHVLLLDTDRKSHMESPTAPVDVE